MSLIERIQKTLNRVNCDYNRIIDEFGQVAASERRERGEPFNLNDHVKGLILAMLSNQRPWGPIAQNLHRINAIFFDYDVEQIKNTNKSYFADRLKEIRCGNRAIDKQMASLDDNISTFEKIQDDYGSIDNFVNSAPPDKIAYCLGIKGEYKMKQIGFTLALEYLRNVGIRAVKPDVHMKRLLSADRLNYCGPNPTEIEVVRTLTDIAQQSSVNPTYLDNLLWIFCAIDYGNICNERPKCHLCSLREDCNHGGNVHL